MPKVLVGNIADLPEGSQKSVRMGRQSVLVIRDQGQFYALRNLCTHDEYELEGGEVVNGAITCEAHGAKFDLATGAARCLPAIKGVRLYRAVVEGEQVFVEDL